MQSRSWFTPLVSEVSGVRSLRSARAGFAHRNSPPTYVTLSLRCTSSPQFPLSVRIYCCCFLSPEVNPRWLQRGVTLHQASSKSSAWIAANVKKISRLKVFSVYMNMFSIWPLTPNPSLLPGVSLQCSWPLRPEEKWAKPRPQWDALLPSMHCCCCSACWSCGLEAWPVGEGQCCCRSRPVTRRSTHSSHTPVSVHGNTHTHTHTAGWDDRFDSLSFLFPC